MLGYLEDEAGNDEYNAPMNMAMGAGHDFGFGMLIERAGNDKYRGPNLSLGAGNANGIGFFLGDNDSEYFQTWNSNKKSVSLDLRSAEGYMAELQRDQAGFLLVENHCPICVAAKACQGFCRSELQLFRAALGPAVAVERSEHLVAGARRCAYRITARSR